MSACVPPRSSLSNFCVLVCALVACCIAIGCKSKKDTPRPDPGAETTTGKPAAGAARGTASAKPRKTRPVPHKDVRALLDTWLQAQNKGDFASYIGAYCPTFRGVRRSGRNIVRLDFAGWKKERKRMFRRSMTVALRRVQISVGSKGAEVRLIQDWQSGKYHDVGPKKLLIRKVDAGLCIAREEMLRSTLLTSGKGLPMASFMLAPLYQGAVLLDSGDDIEAWGVGKPELVLGEIPERDSECDDNTPDYETENERYFFCESNGPENTHVEFSVDQEVDEKRLPEELRKWRGRALTLYRADGTSCTDKVVGFRIVAYLHTLASEVGASDDDDATIAAAVLDQGAVFLLGRLRGSCSDALYARASDLPPPTRYAVREVTGKGAVDIRKGLEEESSYRYDSFREDGGSWGAVETMTAIVVAPESGPGRELAIGVHTGPLDCTTQGFAIYVWDGAAMSRREFESPLYEDDDASFEVLAAIDADGDKVPELLTDFGFMYWHKGTYFHHRPMDTPQPLHEECYCGCE